MVVVVVVVALEEEVGLVGVVVVVALEEEVGLVGVVVGLEVLALGDLVGDLVVGFLVALLMVYATWYLQSYPAYAVVGCYKTALEDPVALLALEDHLSDLFYLPYRSGRCFN